MSTPLSRWLEAAGIARGTSRGLVLALLASAAVHALVVAWTFGGRDRNGLAGTDPGALRAVLKVPDAAASLETMPMPVPMTVPAPVHPPLATLSLSPVPPLQPESPAAKPRGGSSEGSGRGQATGRLLVDRSRLGDLHARGQTEYPIEVDRPPRIDGRIAARYPAEALAAAREDSVVAWVVVNEQGMASEIEIVEGTEEFAEQVRVALRAAHFFPAEDKLKPIRFPIALQFDFRTGVPTSAFADPAAPAK